MASSIQVRDRSLTAPYSPRMRKRVRNPYESAQSQLFADFPASSAIGVQVRRGDAQLRLDEMEEAEAAVRRQEAMIAEIENRIEQRQAEQRLNMQYLAWFGVAAGERDAFRSVLQDVAQDGGLSLYSAAELARWRSQFEAARQPSGSTESDHRNGTSPVPASSDGGGSVR